MRDFSLGQSRRRFLSDLAILGLTPLVGALRPFGLQPSSRPFSGDDLDEAHRLFADPGAVLQGARIDAQPGVKDVLVIGGGIAGLATTYWLRGRDVLLLEHARETGGVSKSETWNGLEYAIGAAYIIDPDPESEDERERRGFELLRDLQLREAGEDLSRRGTLQRRTGGDANHCVFTNTRVVPPGAVYSARNTRFFETVLDSDDYPSVPPTDPKLVKLLDNLSFADFLKDAALQRRVYRATAGPLSPTGVEAVEYYFWGAFGTTAAETSAYHGLNFFAAEFGSILVFPGGNARIAKRLTERILRDRPASIRTSASVLRIEPDAEARTWAVVAHEQGAFRRYTARSVVFASPLFLAPAILPWIEADQRRAIRSLEYRSYVVANVLLRRNVDRIFTHPAFRNGYELTRVHGPAVKGTSAEAISRAKVFSDAVVADFPVWRHADRAVLTVYRPYPYASGRADLMTRERTEIESDVRRSVLEGFGRHGLEEADIEDIAVARWGHPMIVARPGQLADGTLARATASRPGLFFAHTDVQGAPAYENALAAAIDAVDGVEKLLQAQGPHRIHPHRTPGGQEHSRQHHE